MTIDTAASVVASRSAATQNTMQLAILRKDHEMEMSLVNMVDQLVRAAAPEGQGTKVDKVA